ncbi:MAG: hypothetical protein HN580_03260 [Deltaproteobacteria bacterium]|jgi:hypothetical protein|nr:hypothetical protein [Deltaproteobacteria bacterium]MBT4262728.1 hypothetical protein [Deltaproteobacteria bacterium]MBT4640897.1 hypothetical protein [Deltaproteobacteria bacterium]MBT6616230.1 hypothetical protein [Deltaproteobacteria bacterium]MBT7156206.1 hypothetical protein [Deltaproteobacteria bacterium]
MVDKILDQIPVNWLDLLEKSEVDQERVKVTDELYTLVGKRLKLNQPNRDEIVVEYAKVLKMTEAEITDSLETLITLRATTKLFIRHYEHLFPKDEKGHPILHPAEIARIHGKSEEEVIETIYRNREKLSAEGLLHDWPEVNEDYLC